MTDQNTTQPEDTDTDATGGDRTAIDWKAKACKWEERAKANKTAADAYAALQSRYDDLDKRPSTSRPQTARRSKAGCAQITPTTAGNTRTVLQTAPFIDQAPRQNVLA